jgi:hypothetical protein
MILKSAIAILGVAVSGPLLHSQSLNIPPSAVAFGRGGLAEMADSSCGSCRKMGAVDFAAIGMISAVDFGMIGLASSQTLRLSIIAFPPSPIFPPTPVCAAQIGFANSSGGAVGPGKVVSLSPGQGDFVDLNGVVLSLQIGLRDEMRPVVTLLESPAGGPSACLAQTEILDNASGFSLVVARGIAAFPPDPIFGLQGVAWGQVLRLNVTAFPPSPCVAQLSFVDRSGNPVGPAPKSVNLRPGQADHLDIAGNSLVPQLGQRAELRPVIAIASGAAASQCAATAEVYDSFNGRTWTWVAAGPSQ